MNDIQIAQISVTQQDLVKGIAMGHLALFKGSRAGLIGAALAVIAGVSTVHAACRTDEVLLRGDFGQARFSVEIADDAQEQAQGLMHRESMPISAGMLFVYPRAQTANFWMRNTLIPLDMLFLDRAGVVQHIHADAIPLDETGIFGGDDVLAVLEINGGLAARLGIHEGAQMRHPAFGSDDAKWPCSK